MNTIQFALLSLCGVIPSRYPTPSRTGRFALAKANSIRRKAHRLNHFLRIVPKYLRRLPADARDAPIRTIAPSLIATRLPAFGLAQPDELRTLCAIYARVYQVKVQSMRAASPSLSAILHSEILESFSSLRAHSNLSVLRHKNLNFRKFSFNPYARCSFAPVYYRLRFMRLNLCKEFYASKALVQGPFHALTVFLSTNGVSRPHNSPRSSCDAACAEV